jgi:hypothetical protein
MKTALGILAVMVLLSCRMPGQETPSNAPAKKVWAYNLTIDGYIVPKDPSYVDPILTADRRWLHLEGRYNYENLRTGSLWVGYNFATDENKKVVLDFTPMVGGVFGRTTGISSGCEAFLTYKRVELSISNEYVWDTTDKSESFYYSWPQITYSPTNWLSVGVVAAHSKTLHDSLEVQPGFLVGVSHKKWEFTTYIFNAGISEPTVALEMGVDF